MEHISTDEAHEILYDSDLRSFWRDSRWYTQYIVVFNRDGELYGFFYNEPATELQEGQDLFEGDPVPIFPVDAHEVTTTEYRPKGDPLL